MNTRQLLAGFFAVMLGFYLPSSSWAAAPQPLYIHELTVMAHEMVIEDGFDRAAADAMFIQINDVIEFGNSPFISSDDVPMCMQFKVKSFQNMTDINPVLSSAIYYNVTAWTNQQVYSVLGRFDKLNE